MKKILIPISFNEESVNSIIKASALFEQVELTLLHCYPVRGYNREYDFGDQDYEEGLRNMLREFYLKHRVDSKLKIKLILRPGNVSEIISSISQLFDLIVISRKELKVKDGLWYSDKVFYIASMAKCPVLLLPSRSDKFSFKNCNVIWHIKRKEIESDVLNNDLPKININPSSVIVKSLEQSRFKSSFWKAIISYSKNHDERLLRIIKESQISEKIDLILLISHSKGAFQEFMKSEIIQLINQVNIPLLIFQAGSKK
ncbi:MAG: universal stress protein [Saprospiraceae bacterium]|nr:universal stress protein [Saprospiraceae bacterium]